jgi:hypothetical protein
MVYVSLALHFFRNNVTLRAGDLGMTITTQMQLMRAHTRRGNLPIAVGVKGRSGV